MLPYQDPSLPVEERVKDLMSRMTVEEKVGQLVQADGREKLEWTIENQHCGSILHMLGDNAKRVTDLARASRLKIPIMMGIDAIHGHSFWPGATIFPTQLGIAPSWNVDLIKEMASITAAEMQYTGICWTFSPVCCIARDLRWGRVGETFGEDPYLIGKFASAMVKGYQGDELSNDPAKVMATAKHYAGYSETQGGRDASEADLSRRKLRSFMLPQFQKCVEAGVGSLMTGYQSMEGLPSTMNPWLLKTVLKEEWGFNGFVVTDWNNVGWLVEDQKVCKDYEEAATVAVQSGNDLMMTTPNFYQGCLDALEHGKLDMKLVDNACERLLRMKFKLGLFENDRYPDLDKVAAGTPEHRAVALEAAKQGLVLLKNDGLLPLDESKIKTIAVIGPNAFDKLQMCGDWSLGTMQANCDKHHPPECIITPKEGLEKRFKGNVIYHKGASIMDNLTSPDEAIQAAKEADVTVVCVGDTFELFGEWKSTATLELQGTQKRLLKQLRTLGKPYIIVCISTKPQIIPEKDLAAAPAVIQQFSPGMLGGQALAEILFGDANPCGRLTISIPYHIGQQPIYYNQVRGQHGTRYADLTQDPRWSFGYGLLYTTMEYTSATLDKDVYHRGEDITVSVEVKNTGARPGTEVVQVYINDVVTSATWPTKELKGYARVTLQPGESKTVTVTIPVNECSIVNAKEERIVENGDFNALVGMSANDIHYTLPFKVE